MESLTVSTHVKHSNLSAINRCRIYLLVFFLSDIVNIRADKIEEWAISREPYNEQHSSLHWSLQQRSPRVMWNKWKSALLDVFTDESTLLASIGAWFDTPVRQDSELWMNTRERCIYIQPNGDDDLH
jgi:hypothetical protein